MPDAMTFDSPMPSLPFTGRALEPDVRTVMPEFTSERPVSEGIPSTHPWEVKRLSPNRFEVSGGKVYGQVDGTGAKSVANVTDKLTVETTTTETFIWVEIGVNPDTTEVTGAFLASGLEPTEESDILKVRVVARLYDPYDDENPYLYVDQIEDGYIYLSADHAEDASEVTGDLELYHEWRVLYSGSETVGETVTHSWAVAGGDVYSQGPSVTVAGLVITGDTGYVLLKITRDASSREVTGVIIMPTLEASIFASDYTDQYVALAYVDKDYTPKVKQLQFERLNVWEDLVIENGEFQLASLRMSSNNVYAPPV